MFVPSRYSVANETFRRIDITIGSSPVMFTVYLTTFSPGSSSRCRTSSLTSLPDIFLTDTLVARSPTSGVLRPLVMVTSILATSPGAYISLSMATSTATTSSGSASVRWLRILRQWLDASSWRTSLNVANSVPSSQSNSSLVMLDVYISSPSFETLYRP